MQEFGYSRKIQMGGERGGLRMYFSENPAGILDLSLCKIPEKTRFHPGDSGVTSLENSKVKNQNPWRFHMNFL